MNHVHVYFDAALLATYPRERVPHKLNKFERGRRAANTRWKKHPWQQIHQEPPKEYNMSDKPVEVKVKVIKKKKRKQPEPLGYYTEELANYCECLKQFALGTMRYQRALSKYLRENYDYLG